MGWRWRKFIRLPGGARASVSKNGTGFSWGFSGLRIGRSPAGNLWISFSISGTGVSFVKYFSIIRSKEFIAKVKSPSILPPPSNCQPGIPMTPNQRLLEKIKKKP